jgi:hypothetical protein
MMAEETPLEVESTRSYQGKGKRREGMSGRQKVQNDFMETSIFDSGASDLSEFS